MSTIDTPNMNLPLPSVGNQPGPDWAENLNAALTLVDSHDHTPGYGVQIPPDGLNINASLPFNDNFAIDVAGVTFFAQSDTPAINTIYQNGVDLYFQDGNNNQVRITQSGAVAGSPGSIANLISPASASYVALSSTFVWQSDTNIAANMDFGAAIMRNLTPNSTFALTLQPPAALSSNYSITLPTLPPVSTSFMQITTGGVISASIPVSGGISGSNIAALTITGANITNSTITLSKMASNSVNTAQIVDTAVTQAKLSAVNTASSTPLPSDVVFLPGAVQTVLVRVTGLSQAIVSQGRPILVNVQSILNPASTSGSGGYFRGALGANENLIINYAISRDDGVTETFVWGGQTFNATGTGAPTNAFNYSPNTVSCVDTPAAGTYTYRVYVGKTGSAAATVTASAGLYLKVTEAF